MLLPGPAGLHALCLAAHLQSNTLLQKPLLCMVLSLVHSVLSVIITLFVATSEHAEFECGASALLFMSRQLHSDFDCADSALLFMLWQLHSRLSLSVAALSVAALHCCASRGDFRAD